MTRTRWPERHPRPGWEVDYTVIGGRLKDQGLEGGDSMVIEALDRALSQAFVAATPRSIDAGADVRYWATVCRKIIQRGTRPVLNHRALQGLEPVAVSVESMLRILLDSMGPSVVDPSFDLHPVHEVPFWNRVHRSDPRVSHWLIPQGSLESLLGAQEAETERWVDFVTYFPWNPKPAVVEIDGDHKDQVELDKSRDRELARAGIPVVRLEGTAVHDPHNAMAKRIESAAPDLASPASDESRHVIFTPAALQRLGFAIVEAVERGFVPAGQPWAISLDAKGLVEGYEPVALDLLASVDDIWHTRIVPDVVHINGHAFERASDGRFISAAHSAHTPGSQVDITLNPYAAAHAPLPDTTQPSIVIRSAFVPADLPWSRQSSSERRNHSGGDLTDRALDHLLQDIYGYDSFNEGQKEAISRVLSGGDTCVLLPTGAGKSLIYQLAGLLRPGVTLTVAPLRSLIDDQRRRLEDNGIDRVAGLHSGSTRTADAKRAVQEAIASGDHLFVLVAPERLQIEEFRQHLDEAAAHQLINLAVVDEAHCVSEWGHQFRTSYLKLGRNLRRFCAGDDDVPPPILALTATASPRVLNDLLYELGLDRSEPGVLHRPSTFDRPNLHYRTLRGVPSSRELHFAEALEGVCADLAAEPSGLAEPRGSSTLSGVVFVPHASSGLDLGIVKYRNETMKVLGLTDSSSIAVFAGTKPREIKTGNWEDAKATNAEAFRSNAKPIMIATNAFGMGIDKPNIRYTVHVSQPSSIEAFAQEAGRSGRDQTNSYCYLISANSPGIGESTIANKASADTSYATDDVLMQLGNIMSSFPPRDVEKESAKSVLHELLESGAPAGTVKIPHNTRTYGPKPQERRKKDLERRDRERALYRLLLLRIIDDYTIEYGAGSFSVFLNPLDSLALLSAARDEIRRMAGGNRKYLSTLEGLENSDVRIITNRAIDALIDTLYETVEPGRTNALREMYLLSLVDEPEAIREKINAYLSEGPVAIILDKVVREESALSETLDELSQSTPNDDEEWAGAATRYLEAYAEHPVLLVVRGLGEAWRRGGSRDEFRAILRRLGSSLDSFGLEEAETLELIRWMLGQLREYFEGRQWAWAPDIWAMADKRDLSAKTVEVLENDVIDLARRGRFNNLELDTVIGRRLARASASSEPMVQRLAAVG